VLEPGVFDYIAGDSTVWEQEPMEKLAQANMLAAYRHKGFGIRWIPCATKMSWKIVAERQRTMEGMVIGELFCSLKTIKMITGK
jgi:hypothetical protein